jgi:hypothetical protein
MARGFGFVDRAVAETKAKGGNSLWAGKLIFRLPGDGDEAIVRFVPDDDGEFVYGAWHHEVPVEGRAWGDLVPCIAQDEDGNRTEDECPGCEQDLPMKFRGFVKLIWRDGPVYKTDDKGKVVKDNTGDLVVLEHKDQVAVWPAGQQVFENLAEIDAAYSGLDSRDFRIKRKGLKLDTEYVVLPAEIDGGPKKMLKADTKLIADSELDLADFIRPPSLEEFEARLKGEFKSSSNGSGSGEAAAERATAANPFKRKK